MARRFLAGRGWRYERVSGMWFKPRFPFDESEDFIQICADQHLYGHHVEEAIAEEVCGWHIARSTWIATLIVLSTFLAVSVLASWILLAVMDG